MTIESQDDIDGIMNAGRIVARVRDAMLSAVEPGMTTAELDGLGGALLERLGARSAPRVTYNFPGATCISVNEQAAHGIPGLRVIQPGDVVNVDVSAEFLRVILRIRVAPPLFLPSRKSRSDYAAPLDWL